MISLSNLPIVIPFLMKDDNTFNRLSNDFPEILADLTTFRTNPNCSCKGRVIKFFSDKIQQDPNLLDKYIYDQQALIIEINKFESIRQQNNYSGKIIVIPKDENAWSNLSKELNSGKFFRGFSIVERENEIAVYLL